MKPILINEDNLTVCKNKEGIKYTFWAPSYFPINSVELNSKFEEGHIYIGDTQATPLEAIGYQILFLAPTAGYASAVYYKFAFEQRVEYKSEIDRHTYPYTPNFRIL